MRLSLSNPGLLPRRAGVRLGQEEEQILPNRLLAVRNNVIRSRGVLVYGLEEEGRIPYSELPLFAMSLLGTMYPWRRGYPLSDWRAAWPTPPDTWTETERANMSAMVESATEEELRDIALVWSLYWNPHVRRPLERAIARSTGNHRLLMLYEIVCGVREGRSMKGGAGAENPFFCGSIPDAAIQWQHMTVGGHTPAEYFGVPEDLVWGDSKVIAENIKVLGDTLRTFPFPRPIPLAPGFWYYENREALANAAKSGLLITEPLARMLITAFTLGSYETVAARIIDWAEERAEKKKKWGMIRLGAAIAIGLIWSAALGPLLTEIIPAGVPVTGTEAASFVTNVAQEEFSKAEVEKIAEDVEQAARVFEVNDPAFAAEVQNLSDTLNWLAERTETSAETARQIAEQQDNPLPTPEEFGGASDFYPIPGVPAEALYIGGGVAAAALLYFLLR